MVGNPQLAAGTMKAIWWGAWGRIFGQMVLIHKAYQERVVDGQQFSCQPWTSQCLSVGRQRVAGKILVIGANGYYFSDSNRDSGCRFNMSKHLQRSLRPGGHTCAVLWSRDKRTSLRAIVLGVP